MTDPPDGWTQLAIAGNEYQAHLIRGALEDEGIPVVLDPLAGGAGAYLHAGSDPTAPVRILVPKDRAEEAGELLAAFEAFEAGGASLRVAEDTSDEDVEVFAARRAGFPARLVIAVAVLAAIVLGLSVSEAGPFNF